MSLAPEKFILIPADAPGRGSLEALLRAESWTPLVYDGPAEILRHTTNELPDAAPAAASGGKCARQIVAAIVRETAGESLAAIRRLNPETFVVGIGSFPASARPDASLRDHCTAQEIVTVTGVGAALFNMRASERELHDRLRVQALRITELEEATRHAQELAVRDELTDLYNRRYFRRAAEAEMERSRRYGSRFAMAMVDIDHFKHFNDTYGHVAGDAILQVFARVLERALRRMDTVARYGGEEFILLLPETQERGGAFDPARLIERIRQAVERDEQLNGKLHPDAPVTISAGVVQYPADGKTVEELILEVDARLFRAKEGGRNRVCATPE